MPLLFPFYLHVLLHGPSLAKPLVVFHFQVILMSVYYVISNCIFPSSKEKMNQAALRSEMRANCWGDYDKSHLPLAALLLLIGFVFLLWYGIDSGRGLSEASLQSLSYMESHPDTDLETSKKMATQLLADVRSNTLL
jgi:hypothetical protein